jgi:thymidylate synthase
MVHIHIVEDCDQAWRAAMNTLESYGSDVRDEDGRLTREVCNLVVEIKHPSQGFPIPGSQWNMVGLEAYAAQMLDPKEKGFDYDYRHRLARKSQIDVAVETLRSSPNTRRAILSTRDLSKDLTAEHTPCLQIAEFLIRDEKLNLICFFRSHDIEQAYPANLFGLNALLEHVANRVGVQPGGLTTVSASAHYYKK